MVTTIINVFARASLTTVTTIRRPRVTVIASTEVTTVTPQIHGGARENAAIPTGPDKTPPFRANAPIQYAIALAARVATATKTQKAPVNAQNACRATPEDS